jgi:hypothetical protein
MKKKNKSKLALFSLLLIVLALSSGTYYFGYHKKDTQAEIKNDVVEYKPDIEGFTNVVSGKVVFNGIDPSSQENVKAELLFRQHSTEVYETTGIILELIDNANWSWDSPFKDVAYDLKGRISINDTILMETHEITVISPSENNVITFNVTKDIIPVKKEDNKPTELSGTVSIFGSVPSGSKVIVYTKLGNDSYSFYDPVSIGYSIKDNNAQWNWKKAVMGGNYTIKAELIGSKSEKLGISKEIITSAPATGIKLEINSIHKPDNNISASIEGSIRVSGTYDKNSIKKVYARKFGDPEFSLKTELDENGNWDLKDLSAGERYEVKAVIEPVQGEMIESRLYIIPAPAKEYVIEIYSSQVALTPVESPILIECQKNLLPLNENTEIVTSKQSADTKKKKEEIVQKFIAKIRFKPTLDVKRFLVESGSFPGETDLLNDIITAGRDGKDLELVIEVDEGKEYYASYAVGMCSDCKNRAAFGEYSDILKFTCK